MKSGTRSYNQRCGLAASLDLLGERWTLLILRELARGPKRFGDLLDGLEGIGSNLLVGKAQVAGGRRGGPERSLSPHRRGRRLRPGRSGGSATMPIFEDLALWGFQLLWEQEQEDEQIRSRAAWAAMAMKAVMDRADKSPQTASTHSKSVTRNSGCASPTASRSCAMARHPSTPM